MSNSLSHTESLNFILGELSIHVVDLGCEILFELRSLRFQGWGEEAVLDAEEVGVEVDVLHLFERLEPSLFTEVHDIIHDQLFHVGVGAQDRERARDLLLPRPVLHGFHFRHDDGYDARLQTLSMDEHLRDILRSHVYIFDLLGGDVLTLGQLEDVFLTVDDLQRPTLKVNK